MKYANFGMKTSGAQLCAVEPLPALGPDQCVTPAAGGFCRSLASPSNWIRRSSIGRAFRTKFYAEMQMVIFTVVY